MQPGDLDALTQQFSGRALPPVKDWQPTEERAIDMRIDRAGKWYYQGGLIARERMVALFSTVLRRDGEQYYLVTPGEKLAIEVEDAPFTVLLMTVSGSGREQCLEFTDNTGHLFQADSDHPIWIETRDADGEPAPYVTVRDNLTALISRPVYYQLADLIEPASGDPDSLGVWSNGSFFPLG